MADAYTKAVLTVIAAALIALAAQDAATPAAAVGEGCGSRWDPCHVVVEEACGESSYDPCWVAVGN